THAMPRPAIAALPPLRGAPVFGEGRGCQFAAFAAACTTSRRRASERWRSRYSTGSAFTCAAISSRNDSCANVFWIREGDRSGPVKNGDAIVCVSTRSLLIVPAAPHLPPTQPATYDGTALLPLRSSPVGSTASRGEIVAGSNPASMPVTTLPGWLYPGRPPFETDHDSQSHAVMFPFASTPAR